MMFMSVGSRLDLAFLSGDPCTDESDSINRHFGAVSISSAFCRGSHTILSQYVEPGTRRLFYPAIAPLSHRIVLGRNPKAASLDVCCVHKFSD